MKIYSALTQAYEVLGIVLYSLGRWPFRIWINFWTTNRDETVVAFNGIKVAIRTRNAFSKSSDISMAYECIARDDYQLRSMDIGKGCILDIGAHIGSFSLAAAKMFPKARIFCFEPSPANYASLRKNIQINNLRNIHSFNKAVSSNEKEISICIDPVNSAANSIYGMKGAKVKVPSLSMEKIFLNNKIKKCAFAKIDCEGAEYDILLNAPNKILEKINQMVIEYHDPKHFGISNSDYNLNNLIKKLEGAGFACRLKKIKHYQGMLAAKR